MINPKRPRKITTRVGVAHAANRENIQFSRGYASFTCPEPELERWAGLLFSRTPKELSTAAFAFTDARGFPELAFWLEELHRTGDVRFLPGLQAGQLGPMRI